ncbi:hypothetical protein [Macrococcus sp. DPC7161]|uniref:hypothetical protein n=1 Tax=Macrococcus sp. DPC7161 TaxID=2507060 RepID=UPI00100AC640|nr:hypothetical protein [Macrococcus sp. DPC7161]RXK18368.1 hypothetical protein ER639_06675 [Macrococcus sp. DPC7161]
MSKKVTVDPEELYQIIMKLQEIDEKYGECITQFEQVVNNNYYQSVKASKSMGAYEAVLAILNNLNGKFGLISEGIGFSAREFAEADEHWGNEFAKLVNNIEG